MRRIRRILIGLAVGALLPVAVSAQKVNYDVSTDQNFGRLKTYAFKESPPRQTTASETTTYDSPLMDERTQQAIAAQLAGRGMTRDDQRPDVYVTARRTFQREYVLYGPGWGWGYPYTWGYPYGWGYGYGYGGPSYTETIIHGTLTIDMENASNGELIWRGTGEKRVHQTSSPESRTKRVVREVSKIFKTFPAAGAVATAGRDVPVAVGR